MTLNLRHETGKAVFAELARRADVVVENFTPGVVDRLSIDYGSVKAINPRVVYCSISGFGQTGPYKNRSAYDQIMQGIGGIMSVTGEPGGTPVKTGIAVTDIGAGMLAAYAIVTALLHRATHKQEEGQYIDVSMLDLQVAWLTYLGGYYFATGENPAKVGAAHPNLVPYQAFMCQDGQYINVAVGSERLWGEVLQGDAPGGPLRRPRLRPERGQGKEPVDAGAPSTGGLSQEAGGPLGARAG